MVEWTSAEVVKELVLGGVIGLAIGMTGVGGGVLAMPALALVVGLPATVAVGTASAYSFLCKCYAVLVHARLGTINYRVSLLFLAGAVPAAILASLFVLDSAADPAFQAQLKAFIAGVMVMSVVLMIVNLAVKRRRSKPADSEDEMAAAAEGLAAAGAAGREPLGLGKIVTGIVFGAIVGGLMGATSVGGGVLVVPLLIIGFGLSAKRTVGSSIFIAVALMLVITLIYLFAPNPSGEKQVEMGVALLMAGGSLGGVWIGGRLATQMPDKALQIVVMGLIVVAAGLMFTGGDGHGPLPQADDPTGSATAASSP